MQVHKTHSEPNFEASLGSHRPAEIYAVFVSKNIHQDQMTGDLSSQGLFQVTAGQVGHI